MDIDAFIQREAPGNSPSEVHYKTALKAAFNRYKDLSNSSLFHHRKRILYEERLFGITTKGQASLRIISALLKEITIQ